MTDQIRDKYVKFLGELIEGAEDIIELLQKEPDNKWKPMQTAPACKEFDKEIQILACVLEFRHISDSASTRRKNVKKNIIQIIWWDQYLEGGNWVNQKHEICFPNLWCLEIKGA